MFRNIFRKFTGGESAGASKQAYAVNSNDPGLLPLFDGVPEKLLADMFFSEGVLYIATTQQKTPELLSFIGLAKLRGVIKIEYLPPDEFFEKKTESDAVFGTFSNEQEYAKYIIDQAYKERASDIHIIDHGAFGTIKFRKMGLLYPYNQIPGNFVRQLIGVIYGTFARDATTTQHIPTVSQDARISKREYLPEGVYSIRVHTQPIEGSHGGQDINCCRMALRLLYNILPVTGGLNDRLKMLGYNLSDRNRFLDLVEQNGMVVISGPIGSGKTTLLTNVMEARAIESPQKAYHSIEDPAEYPMEGVTQSRFSIGKSTSGNEADARREAYTAAISDAMRSDINIMMIGELRYPEAVEAALHAALSGHGVLVTLHASSALGIIRRMEAMLIGAKFVDPMEFLCDEKVISGLTHQRLVPILCPHCKIPYSKAKSDEVLHFNRVMPSAVNVRLSRVANLGNVYVRGEGCEQCRSLGFIGQTVASEVIVTNHQLLSKIRNGRMMDAYEFWLKSMGGKTYVQDAIDKINEGILDPYVTEQRLGTTLGTTIYGDEQYAGGVDS
jgi:type II secretory ATPase GspE/PulE/Tfp pilus assembly ATPase PilB-like protein